MTDDRTKYPVRKLLAFTAEQWQRVRAFRFRNEIDAESEAARRLIDLGLEAAEKAKTGKGEEMSRRGSTLKWDLRAFLAECAATKDADECWIWPGVESGPMKYGLAWNGKEQVYAHRWAYELSVGPIPPGIDVLHKCDVPKCVNTRHHFLGTDKENSDDKVIKGRACRELTPDDVCAIALSTATYAKLAAKYSVSVSTISEIKSGRKHAKLLAARGIVPVQHEEQDHARKLTDEEARAIYYDTRTVRVIAAEYGISAPAVSNIKTGITYPHIHQEALARGDAHVKKDVKFDDETVLTIYLAKESQSTLAKRYNTTQATVSRIKARKGVYDGMIAAALAKKDAA